MMNKKNYQEKTGLSEDPVITGTPGLDLISLGLVDAETIPKYELTASMMNLSSTKTSSFLSSLGISREMVRIENGTSGFETLNNGNGGESEMVCGRAGVR